MGGFQCKSDHYTINDSKETEDEVRNEGNIGNKRQWSKYGCQGSQGSQCSQGDQGDQGSHFDRLNYGSQGAQSIYGGQYSHGGDQGSHDGNQDRQCSHSQVSQGSQVSYQGGAEEDMDSVLEFRTLLPTIPDKQALRDFILALLNEET